MKTAELTGAALDWAVAKAEGRKVDALPGLSVQSSASWWMYSADWAQGGPIIERERIRLDFDVEACEWLADASQAVSAWPGVGPTPLIAAMRCFVHSKLGAEVDVPKELLP